jgi:hypothetical protein
VQPDRTCCTTSAYLHSSGTQVHRHFCNLRSFDADKKYLTRYFVYLLYTTHPRMAGLRRVRLDTAAQASSMLIGVLRSSVGCAGTADGDLEDLADGLNGTLCQADAAKSSHAAFTIDGLEQVQEQIEQLENAAAQLETLIDASKTCSMNADPNYRSLEDDDDY